MTTPPPIESTGENLTDEQRRQAGIAECERQIAKWEEKMRLLEINVEIEQLHAIKRAAIAYCDQGSRNPQIRGELFGALCRTIDEVTNSGSQTDCQSRLLETELAPDADDEP